MERGSFDGDFPPLKEDRPMLPTEYDTLLRANLERVFNERDDERRAAAIQELYVDEPVMYEPEGVVEGRAAIAATAGKLLATFGPTFRFVPDGRGIGHHGMATLRWHAGPEGGPITVTGFDTAEIVEGRIARLWVLLG
ncbi:MAG: nuclear transport factor 2 family protein [Minicystis sp.]